MLNLLLLFILGFSQSSNSEVDTEDNNTYPRETRRILKGARITDTRPYMVYLRPTKSDNNQLDPNWLCGGVIIHERYILTSAACIEDINYFYVVSGTYRWLPPSQTNECIENGAIRAVWKCIPRTNRHPLLDIGLPQGSPLRHPLGWTECNLPLPTAYRFDGHSFNNIRWMVNDIAVVMTEDPFNFYRKVKGCDYIPKKINYNNISKDLEDPGTRGFLAGWGSTDSYTDAFTNLGKTHINSHYLMETTTLVIQKSVCKNHWEKRYHNIIDDSMICGKRFREFDMTSDCSALHAACRQLWFQDAAGPRRRKFEADPDQLLLDSAAEVKRLEKIKKISTRRLLHSHSFGGFCENDHGGPLIVGHGRTAVVIGIISAYKTHNLTKKCFGPFLYSSVFDNRYLIQCAIYKEMTGDSCTSVLRDFSSVLEEETFDWGPTASRNVLYDDLEDMMVRRSENGANLDSNNTTQINADAGLSTTDSTTRQDTT